MHDVGKLSNKPLIVVLVRNVLSHLSVSVETPDLPSFHLPDEDPKTFDPAVASQLCSTMLFAIRAELRSVPQAAMPLDHVHQPWFSLVQHKIYIITRLAQLAQRPRAGPEHLALFEAAKEGLNKWLHSGMRTGNLHFALALFFIQFVFELQREQWIRQLV